MSDMDLLILVPYKDPRFGTTTFRVCTVIDLIGQLMDDESEPDDVYDEGLIGVIQRAAIDQPMRIGTPKAEEVLGFLERAAASNSADGFTYWDPPEEET